MILDSHAVPYNGENKDLVEEQHMDNRQRVMHQGYVSDEDIEKVS